MLLLQSPAINVYKQPRAAIWKPASEHGIYREIDNWGRMARIIIKILPSEKKQMSNHLMSMLHYHQNKVSLDGVSSERIYADTDFMIICGERNQLM